MHPAAGESLALTPECGVAGSDRGDTPTGGMLKVHVHSDLVPCPGMLAAEACGDCNLMATTVTPPAPVWWVYMLECAGDRIYTGISPDVRARYALHLSARGAAYTRINKPLRILAAMPCGTRSVATKTEISLKKLSRRDKLRWAAQWPWVAERSA